VGPYRGFGRPSCLHLHVQSEQRSLTRAPLCSVSRDARPVASPEDGHSSPLMSQQTSSEQLLTPQRHEAAFWRANGGRRPSFRNGGLSRCSEERRSHIHLSLCPPHIFPTAPTGGTLRSNHCGTRLLLGVFCPEDGGGTLLRFTTEQLAPLDEMRSASSPSSRFRRVSVPDCTVWPDEPSEGRGGESRGGAHFP
jgi:hypothetical protein